MFEEEYAQAVDALLAELPLENVEYRDYLAGIEVAKTHRGYFSIDKKGRMTDPKAAARGELAGQSTEPSDYDLILKDKERLLSFEEPTRFIFSHSALREGWDNPNVFVMCMLKHNESQNTISRRQEVGRGLRIAVNRNGERMDHPVTVHDINVLTVVASESYKGLSDDVTDESLRAGSAFVQGKIRSESGKSAHSRVSYDVIGSIAQNTDLTRKTVGEILAGIQPAKFGEFAKNPEQFIADASHLIQEQKATAIIEKLTYDAVEERYDSELFTAGETGNDFKKATEKLKNHVYDYAIVDSKVERDFVRDLDTSAEVVVYSKLPRGFLIPTPVGDYNPDWAIAFKEGGIKHLYFVAETKSDLPSMKMRELEQTKIKCARKFFDEIGRRINDNSVKYDVVTSYSELMSLVKGVA